jgi:hypothetical protein
MITQENIAEVDQRLSLAQRRAYMQLPLEERRKHLAAQADRMIEHYEQEPEQTERLAWQGARVAPPQNVEKFGSSILTPR